MTQPPPLVDVGDRGLQLAVPPADHVALAIHHGVKADRGDVHGMVFLLLCKLGIHKIGSLKEIGFRGPWHETSYGHHCP